MAYVDASLVQGIPRVKQSRGKRAASSTTLAPAQPAPPNGFGSYDAGAGWRRDATLAQNAYSRFLAQQRGARDLGNIDIAQTRGLETLGAGMAQRGLTNSGIYQTAQNDYAQGWMQQRQDAMDRLYQSLRDAAYSDTNAWADFNNSVADKEAEKAQQILQTAAQLASLKPFMGG